jgi:hypothetical protein
MLTRENDIDVHALHRQGWTVSAIARHLGRDRKTIRAYLAGREAGVRAGRRSIAITRHVVDRHHNGKLSDDVLAGLLSHEIGHLVTQSVRWLLIIAWFAMPWRLACRASGRIAAPLAARQPRALLAVVVPSAFTIAISQAIRHGEWNSAAVLSALALCPVISPIADAAISRASEHRADRYAAQIGYAKALTLALRTMQVAGAGQPRHQLLHDHPNIDRRLRRLETALGQPHSDGEMVCRLSIISRAGSHPTENIAGDSACVNTAPYPPLSRLGDGFGGITPIGESAGRIGNAGRWAARCATSRADLNR